MSSEKQRQSQSYFVAIVGLMGVSLVLNACGNPLNGEKLSIFPAHDKKASGGNPGHAPGGQTKPSPSPSGAPGGCVLHFDGRLDPRDEEVVAFNKAVAEIENPDPAHNQPQPEPEDLRRQILKYVDEPIVLHDESTKLGLKGEDLKKLVEQILALSHDSAGGRRASAPTAPSPLPNQIPSLLTGVVARPPSGAGMPEPTPLPAPAEEGGTPMASEPAREATPPPPAKPYFLHPSIVAFVAYKTATGFAQGLSKDHLKLTIKDTIALGQSILAFGHHDQAILAYKMAYRIATKKEDEGLGYSDKDARLLLGALLGEPAFQQDGLGLKLTIHWINTYNQDIEYGISPKEAIEEANKDICYRRSPGDPLKGYYGPKPGEGGIPKVPRPVMR